jgi:hypothetical protein
VAVGGEEKRKNTTVRATLRGCYDRGPIDCYVLTVYNGVQLKVHKLENEESSMEGYG